VQTIVDLIERSFSLHKSRGAIRIHDNLWTYNDLQDLSSKISRFLLKSGIKKGDRVVVLMNKSIYLYAGMVGIIRAGGVYVPLDTRTPSARLAKILEDLTPFYIFIDCHSLRYYQGCQELSNRHTKALCLDEGRYNGCEKIDFEREPKGDMEKFSSTFSEDLALILYTSGSTGVPKGAMITHGSLYSIIDYTIETFDYGPEDVGSALSANGFDGSLFEMLPILCSGGTLGVYPERVLFVKDILELTYKYRITKLFLIPSTLNSLIISELIQPELLSRMEDVFLGGESIPVNTLIKTMSLLPQARFHNLYGPAETTLYTSEYTFSKRLNPKSKNLSIGFPIVNTRYILDRADFKDEKNKGELLIAGPQVGAGYWNDPERTINAFGVTDKGERYYRTGDIVSYNAKVGYFFHGRKDQQIKFKGYRIELGEIEQTLSLSSVIKENVVIPVYKKGEIEELRLIYSADGDCGKEIRRHLGKNLPSYMIPKSMIRVESLPKNQNDKIDRVLIKKLYGGK